MGITDKKLLRHDHVIQRRVIAEELLAAKTEADIEAIMEDVVGCTVTKTEHELLGQFDSLPGWQRYKAANISVVDTKTGSKLVFDNFSDTQSAQKINIVSKPNDWSHSVAQAIRRKKTMSNARAIDDSGLSETRETQLAYWTAFEKVLAASGGPVRGGRKPQPKQWMNYPIGRSFINLVAFMVRPKKQVAAALYFEGVNAKALFHSLKQEKAEIERELGYALVWEELPAGQDSRISIYLHDVDPENKAHWMRQHEWLVKRLSEMHRVLAPRVRVLPRFPAT